MTALLMNQFFPQSGVPASKNEAQAVSNALKIFNRSLVAGWFGQAWSKLSGRSNGLVDLEKVLSQASVSGSHYAGARSVSIDRIQGSQGRSADFDVRFHPLHERTRDRWVSVAAAMQTGVTLPPVELVQVGDHYFVRDGHHRISAARALGQIRCGCRSNCFRSKQFLEMSGKSIIRDARRRFHCRRASRF